MKKLQDYIIEHTEEVVDNNINEGAESKSITFNFKDLENAEEILKSLEGQEYCTIEDEKLTIEITKENVDKFDTVQDILQQYCQKIRSSQKRSENEQYAQKTKSFEDKLNEFNDALDEIGAEDDDNKDNDKDKQEDE